MITPSEVAESWLHAGRRPEVLPDDPQQLLQWAWALKHHAFAAWSGDPGETRSGAQALAHLAAHARAQAMPAATAEACTALWHWTQALARLTQGEMADAIDELDRAQGLWQRLGEDAPAAQTRVPRIMALSMLGRHAEAVACAEEAQQRFIALGDRLSAAKTSLNLGSLHLRHDQYAQAVAHYRQASVLFARVGQREHSVMADIGIGDALTALGDVEEAARIYARARMRAEHHGLALLGALVDESAGLLDLVCGRYGEALAALESARRRYERLDLPQHLAIAEKQLADAYLALRLLPAALALYEKALQRLKQLQQPDDEAWTWLQQGRTQALLRRTGPAELSFAAARQGFEAQDSPVGLAAVALAEAELAAQRGDAGAALAAAGRARVAFDAAGHAIAALEAAVVEVEAALASGHAVLPRVDTLLQTVRGLQLGSLEVRCHVVGGDAAQAAGDRAAARQAWLRAITQFEAQRLALPSDDTRIAFLTDHLGPYRGLLSLALSAFQAQPGPAQAAEVLHWLDRTRARALDERLATGRSPTDSPAASALRARWNWVTRELQRRERDGVATDTLEASRRDLERELMECVRRDRLALGPGPAATDLGPSGEIELAEALRSRLGPDEALVEYGFDADRLVAVVVRHTGLSVVVLPGSAARLRETVSALRFQIDTLRHGAVGRLSQHMDRLTSRTQAHLGQLHRSLWAPLAGRLDGVDRVQLVLPADLAAVPFAALWDGDSALCDRIALSSLPSARWWLRNTTGCRPERVTVVAEASWLAHVAGEARAVASYFPGARVLEGKQARADLLAAHAGDADVLHLACHAEYRSDNPMFSAVHLQDGLLTAAQVEQLSLKPGASVVLAACDTALGDDSPGDEHLGLIRAFMVAGAARVLAALWPVDDAATAEFMRAFYGHWRGGRSAAEALRSAQHDLRATHPHPYHWAGFTLHGGW